MNNSEKSSIHNWVRKQKGVALVCDHCGRTREKYMIDWSNIDHQYKEKLDDYVALCRSCHTIYDIKLRGKTNSWGKLKKITRHPRLLQERDKLIRQAYYDDGFFIEEIAQMFRLGKASIGKVVHRSKIKTKIK